MKTHTSLVILGGGGHALCLFDLLARQPNTSNILGYVSETAAELPSSHLGNDEVFLNRALKGEWGPIENIKLMMGIGVNTQLKAKLFDKYKKSGFSFVGLIDPSAVVLSSATLGEGVVIFPNAVIGAKVVLDDDVLIHSGTIVEHETKIESHSYLAPGVAVAGKCHIGARVVLGVGSCTLENLRLANNCVLGAGAVLVKSCDKIGATLVGVPAKELQK